MAMPVAESFDEKLASFRRLLHDAQSDSDINAQLYTEHNISMIRDLTLCLQVTTNRHVFGLFAWSEITTWYLVL